MNPDSQTSTFHFRKRERLCSTKLIGTLFASGNRLTVFPYSVRWMTLPAGSLPEGTPAQVLIGVSKKKFRHAVDRNRVKRLIRECYRLQKHPLYSHLQQNGLCLVLSFQYLHTQILDYNKLYNKMSLLIEELTHALSSSPSSPSNEVD